MWPRWLLCDVMGVNTRQSFTATHYYWKTFVDRWQNSYKSAKCSILFGKSLCLGLWKVLVLTLLMYMHNCIQMPLHGGKPLVLPLILSVDNIGQVLKRWEKKCFRCSDFCCGMLLYERTFIGQIQCWHNASPRAKLQLFQSFDTSDTHSSNA